jgi:predicted 3-demethylubiquinone-9 3-methyltransferase (glyoxalase superfamily)
MELGRYPFSERFGWLEDKYGFSWQIVPPAILGQMLGDENAGKPEKVMETMMEMEKINILISNRHMKLNDA